MATQPIYVETADRVGMLPQMPAISVIIPTLNREGPLCNTLGYFLKIETYPVFEVIVIDQSEGHLDATCRFLARNAADFRYITADYKSLPKARNHGVKIARGEIIVFVDDDVEPAAGFLFAHARCYVDPTVVGVAGPVLERGDLLKKRGEIEEIAYRDLIHQRVMRFDVDFPFSAQWAKGCNMSFRRTLITDLGGFDELFRGPAIGEDAEFSYRARKKGTIYYAPDARLLHLSVPSGGCRDATSQREYLRQVAFCVNYFHFRVETPIWGRWSFVWRALRAYALNSRSVAAGNFLQSGVAFAEGLWSSAVHIRRLRKAGLLRVV